MRSNSQPMALDGGAAAIAAAAALPLLSGTASAKPMTSLVGPGCASYAQKVPAGPGSMAGMAQDPVAVAASKTHC